MNQTIPIHQVSAFAEAPFEGNPAAICTLDAWLPEVLMQAIAAENNLSETAFVVGELAAMKVAKVKEARVVFFCLVEHAQPHRGVLHLAPVT